MIKKRHLNVVLAVAMLALVIFGGVMLSKRKNLARTELPNASVVRSESAQGSSASANPQSTSAAEVSGNQNQSTKEKRGELPLQISYEVSGLGDKASADGLVKGFEDILKKYPIRISKSSDPTRAFYIHFVPFDRSNVGNSSKDFLVKASLSKTQSEKWQMTYSFYKGMYAQRKLLMEQVVSFPMNNPLPSHKAFYSDPQIGAQMAHYLQVEVTRKIEPLKPKANSMRVETRDRRR